MNVSYSQTCVGMEHVKTGSDHIDVTVHKALNSPLAKIVKVISFCTLQGSYMSKKCQGIFFKLRELSGNSMLCQGKVKFCINLRDMSGNFTFQSNEARIFVPKKKNSSSGIGREI